MKSICHENSQPIGLGNFIILFLIFSFGAACIIPYLDLQIERIIQILGTMVLFVFMLFQMKRSKLLMKVGLGLICYYAMIMLYWVLGISSAGVGNYFYQITFFVFFPASLFCLSRIPPKYNAILYSILIAIVILRCINDIVIGQRFVGYTLQELDEVGSTVSSTPFNTTALFIFCIAFLLLLNTKTKISKIINIVILAIAFYYIVFGGQRGSVVIIMLISMLLIFYEKRLGTKRSGNGIRYAFLILIFLLLSLSGDYVFSILIHLSPSERLTDRFIDLQGTYQHGITDDSFSGRLSLLMVSLETWTKDLVSFFFGIGDHRLEGEWGILGFAKSGIGGHSELIDSLARYGIVGFSIITYLYYHISKCVLLFFDNIVIRNQVKAILVVSLLVSLTKGLFFPEIGLALFLILPLTSIFLNKQNII